MDVTCRNLGGLDLVEIQVDEACVDDAKAMRARRDARYGNIYRAVDTDERWVGDLGEACMAKWLASEQVPYDWLSGDDAAGLHDFTVAGWRMGVKTVKRSVPVRADYTAQITERHADEPSDGYFFLTYHVPSMRMWLLGAIGRMRFLEEARHYGPGELVHANYRVRGDHAIRNIGLRRLTAPVPWLGMVRQRLDAIGWSRGRAGHPTASESPRPE